MRLFSVELGETYDKAGRYVPPPGPPAFMQKMQAQRQVVQLVEIDQQRARDAAAARRAEKQLAQMMREELARGGACRTA